MKKWIKELKNKPFVGDDVSPQTIYKLIAEIERLWKKIRELEKIIK